jgi:hypothetical protein
MTVRTQYGVPSNNIASLVNATQTLTMNRPRTLPVETNTIDFVARGYTRQEFEGGLAHVQFNTAGTAATLSLRAVEILNFNGNVSRTVLSTTQNSYLGNAAVTTELLARILLSEDEAGVRLTVIAPGGGPIANVQAFARFDFGLNNANYGSNQGL